MEFMSGYAVAFLKVCIVAVAIMAGLTALGKIYLHFYRRLAGRHARLEADATADDGDGNR